MVGPGLQQWDLGLGQVVLGIGLALGLEQELGLGPKELCLGLVML